MEEINWKEKADRYLKEQLGYIYCHNCKFNDNRDDCYRKKMGLEASDELINKAIELASTPDWYYPEKSEFPKLKPNDRFLYFIDNPSSMKVGIFQQKNKDYFINEETEKMIWWEEIKTWTYLPKFKEDE